MTIPEPVRPLAAREFFALADLSHPYIPELHEDDCEETTCVACRTLTPSTHDETDAWLDKEGVFAKPFWEYIDGSLTVTGLKIGHRPGPVAVAKYGDTIRRRHDGTHTVHPAHTNPNRGNR